MNETIVTGRILRKLIDKKNNLWQKISFWTKACDVEFDDGTMLEGKFGALSNDVSSISNNLNTLSNSVSTLQSNINTLSTTVSNKNGGYDSNISQINTKIEHIEAKNSSQDTKIENLESKIGGCSFKAMSLSDYNSLPSKEANVLYFCY